MTYPQYDQCILCPRECKAARNTGKKGICGIADRVLVSRAALHFWEEPCISGVEGSGAVFFSGCSLGCVFCQNREISRGEAGVPVDEEQLAHIFLNLQEQGANNINLVTAGHVLMQVREALLLAKRKGLHIPVVYNTSSYEKVEALQLLDGLVDIYLPDFKYMLTDLSRNWSKAADYVETAKAAIAEMVSQIDRDGTVCTFDERGMMKRGVIVRHLLMPGNVKQAKAIVDYLYETYKDKIYLSLMSQYTPMDSVKEDILLGRKTTKREYDRLLAHVMELGIEHVFIQEGEVAEESFIPAFDGTGIIV